MMINNNLFNSNAIIGVHDANKSLATSFERLSSGKKINRASDDPAGLVISEQMRAKIAGIEQQIQNLETEANKLTTADGYLDSQSKTLTEMRTMALSASNDGVLDDAQKEALQQSINSAVKSYNDTINNAAFGNQALLDGSEGSEAAIEKISGIDLSSPESAAEAIEKIDAAIEEVNAARGDIGSRQSSEVESGINNLRISMQNLTQAQSVITDTDYALEYSNMVSNTIKLQASVAMIAQGNMVSSMISAMLNNPAHHVGV